MERVFYFQDYVVVDAGNTPLKEQQLLTEEQYRECRLKYGDSFKAGMGAESVRDLLRRLDLDTVECVRQRLSHDRIHRDGLLMHRGPPSSRRDRAPTAPTGRAL
jgi:DNA-directed RNA polymerase beta' subunit